MLGHSYGGSVITGLTGVRHLVYVAAFVPDEGENTANLGGMSEVLQSAIVRLPDGSTRLDRSTATAALYQDCPSDVAAWATQLLRVQLPGCGRGVPKQQAWRLIPSTYVICADDRVIAPELQQRLAARCRSTRILSCGHSPFISQPQLIADLVREIYGAG